MEVTVEAGTGKYQTCSEGLEEKRKKANGDVNPAGAAPVDAGGCEATGKPLVCEFVSQNLGTR